MSTDSTQHRSGRDGQAEAAPWPLWRETPAEYRLRLLDAASRREERAAWLRLSLRAEEEVLAELTRLEAQRGANSPPVQPGVFPDGPARASATWLGF